MIWPAFLLPNFDHVHKEEPRQLIPRDLPVEAKQREVARMAKLVKIDERISLALKSIFIKDLGRLLGGNTAI